MSERSNKTSIGSVIFLDIVNYSEQPDSTQIKLKGRLEALLAVVLKGVAQDDRIMLDTGDGAAIALLGAPEEALYVALAIHDGILQDNQHHDEALLVRTGVNLGPLRIVSDINGHPNILGDGINTAQRVMSFAAPNEILVSRTYYEIVSRISSETISLFSYSGIRTDKHVREHEVYAIRTAADEAPHLAASEAEKPHAGYQGLMVLAGMLLLATAFVVVWLVWPKAQHQAAPLPVKTVPPPIVEAMPNQNATAKQDVSAKDGAIAKQEIKPDQAPAPVPALPPKDAKPKKVTQSAPKKAHPEEHAQPASGTPEGGGQTTPTAPPAEQHPSAGKEPEKSQQEKEAQESDKSFLDKLKQSVKQGVKPPCSDSERALGQCR